MVSWWTRYGDVVVVRARGAPVTCSPAASRVRLGELDVAADFDGCAEFALAADGGVGGTLQHPTPAPLAQSWPHTYRSVCQTRDAAAPKSGSASSMSSHGSTTIYSPHPAPDIKHEYRPGNKFVR